MLISQALTYARVLLADGWCQGADARDERGEAVEPWDLEAVAWSLVGAVAAVANDAEAEIANVVERVSMALALALDLPIDALRRWNDEPQRTRGDVLDACDRAVELLPELIARYS
jgi:hypothetical protein